MITKHPTSRSLIVHPLGDLDTLRTDHYRRQLRSLIDEGYRFLIFDLQDTSYINSSGLGLLIELYNKTTRMEGSVNLINCSPHVLWMLEQTHLDKILLEPANPAQPREPIPNYDALIPFMSDEMVLLARIHEVTEKILGLDDIGEIAKTILKGLAQALQAQRGVFFLLNEQGSLTLGNWLDTDETRDAPDLGDFPHKPGHFESKILDEGQIAWHELGDQDKAEDNLFYRLGYDTLLIAPIRGHNRKIGLMAIDANPETVKIIQVSTPLIRTMTNVCGLAMEKTMLALQLHRQNQALREALDRGRDYQHSLMDAGKLAALGVVLGGLGHLINNKMVPLLGYTQMLSQKKDLSQWVSDKIARINASGHEMSQIVDKLVKIGRLHDNTPKPTDLAELIRTALDLLAYQIQHEDITIHVQTEPDSPVIHGHPDLLLQALLAILHRSCTSFSPGNPERWIRIMTQAAGDGLRLVIEDNGGNYDAGDEEDWLDPLVSTTDLENGRIFNYTIPRAIVRKHKGTLTLETVQNEGKRVIIDLPSAEPSLCAN